MKNVFSRWSRRAFDFAHFNALLIDHELPEYHERIAAIDAQQTFDVEEQSRVDHYAQHFRKVASELKKASIRYLASDSYYSKVKFIDAVCEEAFDLIGKLRICTGFTPVSIEAMDARKNIMERSISCLRKYVLTVT